MWLLWREHNQQTFEGVERLVLELKSDLRRSLYEWVATLYGHSFTSFDEYSVWPIFHLL
jgi:hypothetical protein